MTIQLSRFMLNSIIILVSLGTPIDSLLAASARIRSAPDQTHSYHMPIARHHSKNSMTTMNTMAQNSLYQHLMQNESFIKWQDMARYFWEQQTGEQRLTSISTRRVYKKSPQRVHQKQP